MLAGKNNNYKGPRTHRAIIRKILAEGSRKNRTLSMYKIEKIVRLFFFQRLGISNYFKSGNNFFVGGVGLFIPNKERHMKSMLLKKKRTTYKRKMSKERWRLWWIERNKNRAEKS